MRPGDTCALMYTSGTTGRPKGAIRSHQGNALIAFATALEMGFTRADTGLMVMPHVPRELALLRHHLRPPRRPGIVIDDRQSFDPEALLGDAGAASAITFTSLVPTHYIMMLALPAATKAQARRERGSTS